MSQMWQCHVHGTQNVHTLSACNCCIIVMCAAEGAAWRAMTAVEDAVLLSAAYNLLKQHGPCTLCAIKHGPFIARHKGTLVSETKGKILYSCQVTITQINPHRKLDAFVQSDANIYKYANGM